MMAEGGDELTVPYSVITTSDQVTPECDGCRYTGTITLSVAFCEDCEEFLCTDCHIAHKKNKASRKHRLIEGDEFTSSQDLEVFNYELKKLKMCKDHPGSDVEFICRSHDKVLCSFCKIHHTKCPDVQRIDKIDDSQTETNISHRLKAANDLQERIKQLQEIKTESKTSLQRQLDQSIKDIKDLREILMKRWEETEISLIHDATCFVESQKNKIDEEQKELDEATVDVQRYITKIENVNEKGDNVLKFLLLREISTAKANSVLDNVELNTREDTKTISLSVMSSNLVDNLQVRVQTSDGQFDLSIHLMITPDKYGKRPRVYRPSQFSTRLPALTELLKDKRTVTRTFKPCTGNNITCTDLSVLPDGDIVVLEKSSKSVLLLRDDETNMDMKGRIQLKDVETVIDMAVVNRKELVVLCENKLQFVQIHPVMKETDCIEINGNCQCVSCNDDKIFVQCKRDSWSGVYIMNRSGDTIRSVPYKFSNFVKPRLAVDVKGRMYISGNLYNGQEDQDDDDEDDQTGYRVEYWKEFSIECIDCTGKVIYSHNVNDIITGLNVDCNQNLYVYRNGQTSIEVVSPDGKNRSTLPIDVPKQQWNTVVSMSYRAGDQTLFLLQDGCFTRYQIR